MAAVSPAGGVGLLGLLRLGNARLYFGGVAVSLFGDNMLLLAAGIWVKTLSGNDGAAALVNFFVTAPVLLSTLFGTLADRVRRRTILLLGNAVMAAVTLALLLVRGSGEIWLIYLVMLAYGLQLAVSAPAESGLLVTMLPERLLGAANSLLSSLTEGMKVIAPAAGAALFVWLGGGRVAVLDAVTFVVALLTLSALDVREPRPREAREQTSGGIGYVTRSPALRRIVYASGFALFTGGLTLTALYGVVAGGLHRQPAYLGLLVSVQGVGSVVSGLVAPHLMARLRERRFVALGMGITAVGVALIAVPALGPILAGQALRGIGQPWIVIGSVTAMQRTTPAAMQGRAAGAVYTLLFVPQAVALLAGPALGQIVSAPAQLALIAAGTLVPCLYLLRPAPAE
jgi:MFS family permease